MAVTESWPTEPPSGSWWAGSGARIGAGVREADALSSVGARVGAFVVVALWVVGLLVTVAVVRALL